MAAKHKTTLEGGAFTPEGFAEALVALGKDDAGKAVRMALDKSKGMVASIFVNRFASRGVGKGIFGRAKRGAFKIVKLRAIGPRADQSFLLAMELRGFASLQETGGRTLPHEIPKRGRKLTARAMPIGEKGFARKVKHPGGPVRANPSGPSAFRAAAPKIASEIDKALIRAIAKRLGR